MKLKKGDAKMRSDGKPRATAAQISAARRKAAKARWAGNVKAKLRTIRVHEETYELLDAMRGGRLTWDGLLHRLASKRRR